MPRSPAMPRPANSACDPSGPDTMYRPCCTVARNQSASEVTRMAAVAEMADVAKLSAP